MNDLKGIIEDCNKSDLVSDKVIKKIIEIIGQEEWQDLHDENNDICTTMGELIITLKGIADLEKENAELKEENRGIKTCANCDEYVIGRCCNYPNGVCHHWKLSEKYKNDDELTKAKEHIENLLYYVKQCTCERSNYAEIEKDIKEAEQFLKGGGK